MRRAWVWFDKGLAMELRKAETTLRQARNAALDEAIDICNQEATIEGIAQRCAARIEALKSKDADHE